MHDPDLLLPLLLSIGAGLSTGLGGLFVFLVRKSNVKYLSAALGFSAGLMIFISFMEMLPLAQKHLTQGAGAGTGKWLALAGFFAGILLIALIDKLIPARVNPHEVHSLEEAEDKGAPAKTKGLWKTGMLTALAITIHNFPEGMVTFVSGINQTKLGIAIALAVAIHNIPEGFTVAIPVYGATGSKKRALLLSLLSGLAEPVGAVLAFLFLAPLINDFILGFIYASIAGIMVFISFDELLPTAHKYGEHHVTVYGLLAGMAVMGTSLLFVI
jgi:ZIP family zinc transporter